MATIINNPGDTHTRETADDSGMGIVVGIIVAIILIALFFMYGLPAIRGGNVNNSAAPAGETRNSRVDLNVTVPPGSTGGTNSNGNTGANPDANTNSGSGASNSGGTGSANGATK